MSLCDLIAKLEGAETGSPELSALVLCAAAAPADAIVEQSPYNGAWCIYEPSSRGRRLWEKRSLPHRTEGWEVTTSLDAIVALVERKLPGCWLDLSGPRRYLNIPTPVPNYWRAQIEFLNGCGWGATPALALCAALLKALSEPQPRAPLAEGDRSREANLQPQEDTAHD